MRKRGINLLIPVLFLLMLALVFCAVSVQEAGLNRIRFQDSRRGIGLSPYYEAGSDQYCLFLPGYLAQEDLTMTFPWYMSAELTWEDGTPESIAQAPVEEKLTLTVTSPWSGRNRYTLRLLRCSARQTIAIETKDGTLEQLEADQTMESEVGVTIVNAQGEKVYEGHGALSGRGNGTWYWDKKPYDLKLPETIDLEGFQDISKLCLLAEYTDASKMRNAMALYAGQKLEIPYASGYSYADLYIDGEYRGLYGIATKQEYRKYIAQDGIKAVFELSSSGKGREFYTDYGKAIRIHYGTQREILEKVEGFENALLARDWERMYQYLDLTSWARKYALDELLANYDLPLTSEYFYLDGGGKIRCMLPWDYEWILYARTAPYDFREERALAAYWSHGNWYEVLLESEAFRQAVAQVLREEFTEEFLDDLQSRLDACADEITGSWHCDRFRWYGDYAAKKTEKPGQTDISGQYSYFRESMAIRVDFMTKLFENWEDHCLILFFSEKGEAKWQTNLQLILPKGADLSAYHQRIIQTATDLERKAPMSVTAQDGRALEEITTVTENMTFTVTYAP